MKTREEDQIFENVNWLGELLTKQASLYRKGKLTTGELYNSLKEMSQETIIHFDFLTRKHSKKKKH